MKRLLLLPFLLLNCSNPSALESSHRDPIVVQDPVPSFGVKAQCPIIDVKFSPRGGVAQSIIEGILSAKNEIFVQAYSFTSMEITEALIKQKNAGRTVRVILDKSNTSGYSSIAELKRAGVEVWLDSKHAIAHNKIIIIDKKIVFTGSYNFTKSAEERNAENSLKIEDNELAKVYVKNWLAHEEHSEKY